MNFKKRGAMLALSIIPNIIAVAVLMLKMFYPYYRVVAFSIYLLGWIPFILSLGSVKKEVKFVKRYGSAIFYAAISLITLWVIFSLFPVDSFKMLISDKAALEEKLNEELIIAENHIAKMHEAESRLITRINKLDLSNATKKEREEILSDWADYLHYAIALNSLLEDNKYFYQINYLKNRELNEKSFVIAYSSFISLYSSSLKIIESAERVSFISSFLNEKNTALGIPPSSYLEMKKRISDPANVLQANAGFAYLQTIKQERLSTLNDFALDDYHALIPFLGTGIKYRLGGAMDYFESNIFVPWFPVQKEIAETIGDTKIPIRRIPLISPEDIEAIKKILQPGDVLIQRRNWYLSNAGLPGFWKHTAIYISNLDGMDKYFNETIHESNITGGKSVSEYLMLNFPSLYLEIKDNEFRTIEAESEGIVSFTLNKSLGCDYLGVIRPNASKLDKLKAIIYSAEQFGKPYDFDFDFLTDNSIVCSELYYKAYPEMNHTLRITSGRLVLSTNHIVEDFAQDKINNAGKFEFVAFIDGDEQKRLAFWSNESEFMGSYKREFNQINAL